MVKKDVEAYLGAKSQTGSGADSGDDKQVVQSASSFSLGEVPADEVVDLTRLRQQSAGGCRIPIRTFPHFYLTRSYRTGALMALRKELNELLPETDKLSP